LENNVVGVPQGSILGPSFSSLCIRDLPEIVFLFTVEILAEYSTFCFWEEKKNMNQTLMKNEKKISKTWPALLDGQKNRLWQNE